MEGAGEDLLENTSTFHTDVDRDLFDKIPLESASSSVSSLVTLATPGIAADSNGLFHGLGDHAENSFSVDGQPITDQQSKVFSNQIPLDSIESMEVISGAPPAEFGDKTSVVINVTTRSGQGMTTPHGSVTASYGSFGTSNVGLQPRLRRQELGKLHLRQRTEQRPLSRSAGVYRDARQGQRREPVRPRGLSALAGRFHSLNLGFTRSWFQTPEFVRHPERDRWTGVMVQWRPRSQRRPVGPTDQRSQIKTFNIAPSWTRALNHQRGVHAGRLRAARSVQLLPQRQSFRRFRARSQQETVGQNRTLTNAGLRSDLSYVKGIHNLKAGPPISRRFWTRTTTSGSSIHC